MFVVVDEGCVEYVGQVVGGIDFGVDCYCLVKDVLGVGLVLLVYVVVCCDVVDFMIEYCGQFGFGVKVGDQFVMDIDVVVWQGEGVDVW